MPLLLLAFALSVLLLVRGGNGYFYHADFQHNWESAHNLALAQNLSGEHGWRLFLRFSLGPDGEMRYRMYSRFPIGGFALLKLVTLPFGDLSAKIVAARLLMLVLFCGAALLAFDALRRIFGDAWVASAATLLAFSSYHTLRYADAVDNDGIVGLFAVMLVFHGVVLHVREARFGQLLAKTGCALLLDWHVYGLLLAFLCLQLAAAAWRSKATEKNRSFLSRAKDLARSRVVLLGVFALLVGSSVLGFNLATEYAAHEGDLRVRELPTVHSLLYRVAGVPRSAAVADNIQEKLRWPSFLFRQIHLLGAETIPIALPVPRPLQAAVGALALGACLLWLPFAHIGPGGRLLLGSLVASGFCWNLAMRHYAGVHDFYSMFHVGVPLALFALALLWLRQVLGHKAVVAATAVCVLLFVGSSALAARLAVNTGEVAVRKRVLAEFNGIREAIQGRSVFVAFDANLASPSPLDVSVAQAFYFLSGSPLQYDGHFRREVAVLGPAEEPPPAPAQHGSTSRVLLMPDYWRARTRSYDFIVVLGNAAALDKDDRDPALLTPDNRFALLYDGSLFASVNDFYLHWYRSQYAVTAAGEAAACSVFDVYLREGELAFQKTSCHDDDMRGAFFLDVVPRDRERLPKNQAYDSRSFRFVDHGAVFDGKCMARIPLPRYAIEGIATGQRDAAGEDVWRVDLTFAAAPSAPHAP